MKPARLLRWYPRAWRERYGEELLALIQDTLDDGRPTWRLRFSVIWAGLRERGHQARRRIVKRGDAYARWACIFIAGTIIANLPGDFKASPPPARAWQYTAALWALIAAVVLTCAVVLADGMVAWPALVRFLRTGGWAKVRRQVTWAAAATGLAAGALAGVVLTVRSHPLTRLDTSLTYIFGQLATAAAVAVAIGLWAATAGAAARHLTLTPRVRAAQLVLNSLSWTGMLFLLSANLIWNSATQASVPWLLVGVGLLVLLSITTPRRIRGAVRQGRQVRARAAPSRGR
jgi:hypothetical protein